MATLNELRSKIADMVGAILTIDEFQDWFLSNYWNAHVHADADPETVALVHFVEGNLLDFESGAIEDETLRKRLITVVPLFAENRYGEGSYAVVVSSATRDYNEAQIICAE